MPCITASIFDFVPVFFAGGDTPGARGDLVNRFTGLPVAPCQQSSQETAATTFVGEISFLVAAVVWPGTGGRRKLSGKIRAGCCPVGKT